ncbi:MAG TPA: hypothetical protein VNI20_01605 [Fimbriimonadaceae bacterium]|nr:hypothetical protein [Fimbriimonadaceae bacterium]
MKYYVVWPDGRKFGPADVLTLNQWIAEGRVHNDMTLEDASTGQRVLARDVPGLVFTNAAPQQPQPGTPYTHQQQPNPYQPTTGDFRHPPQPSGTPYPRGGAGGYVNPEAGKTEFIWSLVCSIGGVIMLCCIPIPIPVVGLVLGYRARSMGHPSGNVAVILGWVMTIVCALYYIGIAAFFLLGTGGFGEV